MKSAALEDPEILETICTMVSQGTPLRQILREQPGMPSASAFYTRIDEKSEFYNAELAGRFARARALGFDAIADSCVEIADDARNDWMEAKTKEEGEEATTKFNAEHVQRSKLRIETRLKLLAKWDPKRYGEKLALGGADDLPPLRSISDDDLMARIQSLQAKVNGKPS